MSFVGSKFLNEEIKYKRGGAEDNIRVYFKMALAIQIFASELHP